MDQQMPIVVGLVGFGASGKTFHAPFIHAHTGFHLKSVVERHRNEAEKQYPYIQTVMDADALFDDSEIELVVITTPNDTHFDLAYAALQAGKHVIVEKPFTTTSHEAVELIRLAKLRNRMLTIFHSRRFEGDFSAVQQVLASEKLGALVEFESHFDRFRPLPNPKTWKEEKKPGIGLLHDLGSHVIDQALTLFGLPQYINADIRTFREHARVNDYFFIRLEYESHLAILRGSSYVKKEGPRFLIQGKKGSFIKYGTDSQEKLLQAGHFPTEAHWGEEAPENWGTLYISTEQGDIEEVFPTPKGSYMNFYNNMYDVLRKEVELIVKPEQIYHVMRVLELAEESSVSKRTLPFSNDDDFFLL